MRIIQIIDSLEIGGAERMAVNYANVLAEKIEFSGLIASRKEGNLKHHISDNVNYLFLGKKNVIDFKAMYKLFKYCKYHNIAIIQAHSSSFFTACLVKIFLPNIKIIWHDHNGGVVPKRNDSVYLKIFSVLFNGTIAVNQELKTWSIKNLFCKKVLYLSNFTVEAFEEIKETVLKGNDGKKILCLANLRSQKNHQMLIKVAIQLKKSHPEWSFHLVGKDFKDDYSKKLKNEISRNFLEENIYLYDSKKDVENIIKQAEIAVFSSISEGLPVSLLEYGMQKKAVLSTNIGEIPLIINDNCNGFLVAVNDVDAFYKKLMTLINDQNLRDTFGDELYKTIIKNHSQDAIIKQYLDWARQL